MTGTANAWVLYCQALGLDANATTEDVKNAYRSMAGNGEHPDHGADPERWKLITAAYGELKNIAQKKRGRYTTKSDEAWLRAWDDLTRPAPKPEEPKAEQASAEWAFEEREGESKDDRRRRYARTRQQWRYANDPEFAKARKEASLRSHKKTNARRKAEKAAKAESEASA